MLTNIFTRKSDAFFRFVVVGRADLLPTPVNLRRWFQDRGDENCRRCDRERKPTLAHILNECTPNYQLMTKRHNRLATVVRKAIERFVSDDLRSEIQENEGIHEEGLSEELRRLKPDMVFERQSTKMRRHHEGNRRNGNGNGNGNRRNGRNEANRVNIAAEEAEAEAEEARGDDNGNGNGTKMMEILEFSCPYGKISRGKDALERVYMEKKRKYMDLAREVKRLEEKKFE